MPMDWRQVVPLIQRIKIEATEDNGIVRVKEAPSELTCIGKGTDAAVFVHDEFPRYAFKVYAIGREEKRKNEEKAYRLLKDSPYFPRFYGSGKSYIVISNEKGINLYDCLIRGIEIPKHVIDEVDRAMEHARHVGLNPRDVHLKNIILQGDHVKLIDVSEYVNPGNDRRWEHLKEGYQLYYPLIASRKIPPSVLDFVNNQYKKQKSPTFSVQKFGKLLLPLLSKLPEERA